MSDPAGVRASDAERERVGEHLREQFAEGRLDAEELAQRLEQAYAARTVGELAGICEDLPRISLPVRLHDQELSRRRAGLRRRTIQEAGGSFGAFAVCAAIWAASGAGGDFWPAWVLIAPGAFLARNLWRLHGPAPELDRVESELRRRSRRDRHLRHSRRRERLAVGSRERAEGNESSASGAAAAEAPREGVSGDLGKRAEGPGFD